jgi:hypothetical protein
MILNLEHVRYGFGLDSTLARLSIDAESFGFVLEDERRLVKVRGETCIPPGRYEIKLRAEGGKHQDYLDRFPELHKGMLWLQDVPDFEWVYYHIGNKDTDSLGCPLTGTYPVILPDGEFEVARSEAAYLKLYRKVLPVLLSDGGRVFTHITEAEPL